MRRIITWLYNKYCRAQLDTLYLGGLQRDFTKVIDPNEEKQRNMTCITFVRSGACDLVFNEILRDYSESLFSVGETEDARNILHNNINVVLKVEEVIKDYAHLEEKTEEVDPYNPL